MGLNAYIHHVTAKLGCSAARKAAISELSSLDDRQLDDIGLYRGAIVAAVESRLYGCSSPAGRTGRRLTHAAALDAQAPWPAAVRGTLPCQVNASAG